MLGCRDAGPTGADEGAFRLMKFGFKFYMKVY